MLQHELLKNNFIFDKFSKSVPWLINIGINLNASNFNTFIFYNSKKKKLYF